MLCLLALFHFLVPTGNLIPIYIHVMVTWFVLKYFGSLGILTLWGGKKTTEGKRTNFTNSTD